MNKLLRRSLVVIVVSLALDGTMSEAEPPTISPEVAQVMDRFFDAIRRDNANDYRAVADGVEISYSDADDSKMSLDRARQEFPDCEFAGITDSQHLSDSAYSFDATIKCKDAGKPVQTVGIIADRKSVMFVRPGGFEPDQKSPEEIVKAEADAQKGLDWLASFPMQVPVGPFKSWSEKQREAVPALVQNTCSYLWTMAHDAPSSRFLPAELTDEDEWTLGIAVCLAGHMPADWPERNVRLQAARSTLQRAAAAGSALRMPTTIGP